MRRRGRTEHEGSAALWRPIYALSYMYRAISDMS